MRGRLRSGGGGASGAAGGQGGVSAAQSVRGRIDTQIAAGSAVLRCAGGAGDGVVDCGGEPGRRNRDSGESTQRLCDDRTAGARRLLSEADAREGSTVRAHWSDYRYRGYERQRDDQNCGAEISGEIPCRSRRGSQPGSSAAGWRKPALVPQGIRPGGQGLPAGGRGVEAGFRFWPGTAGLRMGLSQA
jgi:hypothetical protein